MMLPLCTSLWHSTRQFNGLEVGTFNRRVVRHFCNSPHLPIHGVIPPFLKPARRLAGGEGAELRGRRISKIPRPAATPFSSRGGSVLRRKERENKRCGELLIFWRLETVLRGIVYRMNKLDFLAIGDITIDAFIRLKDAHVHCKIDSDACELCVRFGDKIPYEFVEVVRAVGNAPNAAVSVARLGLSSGLVTDIGDDENGRECLEALKKEKVDTRFVTKHTGTKTNYHYVLWFEAERTILVKHEKFDYVLPKLPEVMWVYLSSLGAETLSYHEELKKYLEEHVETKLTFQPGTFQINAGVEVMRYFYRRAELLVVNVEEARRILELGQTVSIKELLTALRSLGPKIVCITDGPKGAYAYDGYTNEYWFQPMYPDPNPPVSRTGAGDAFASTFTSALILGKAVKEALQWAPVNSAYVVQQIGAQKGLLTREQLEEYLKKAPSDYKPRKI